MVTVIFRPKRKAVRQEFTQEGSIWPLCVHVHVIGNFYGDSRIAKRLAMWTLSEGTNMTRLIPKLRRNPRTRRVVRDVARTGAALSAVMFVFSTVAVLGSGQVTAATGFLGAARIVTPDGVDLIGGGSGTEFAMLPPSGAACEGSGAGVPAYRWQTYMVAASVDVANLKYATGPLPVGEAFVSPLFDNGSATPIVNKSPAASPLGLIQGIPTMSFAAFAPAGTVPAGAYKLGFACTKAGVTDSFWTIQITIADSAGELPSGFVWSVETPASPTTTTTVVPTTTTVSPSTTMTIPRATTTTAPRTTTTSTTAPATTTTTTAPTTTTTTTAVQQSTTTTIVAAAAPPFTTAPPFVSPTRLPVTGSSSVPVVIWGILLLVFGRMAILFARPLKVVRP